MKRRHGHAAFAAVTAGCAALSLWAGWNLARADRVNAAIAAAARGAVPTDLPESQLAHAQFLAARGHFDAALAGYKAGVHGDRADLKRVALYDAANLHLRRALEEDPGNQGEIIPLVEIAKQHYRDLLREDPAQWDARYNLELALRLAPENLEPVDEDSPPPDNRESRSSTNAAARMDLP